MSTEVTNYLESIPTQWTLKGFVVTSGEIIQANGYYYLNFQVSHGKSVVSCVIKADTQGDIPELTPLKAIHLNCLQIQQYSKARNFASMSVEIIEH